MITTVFLNIVTQIVYFFLSLLPAGIEFPEEWVNAVYSIWSAINAYSFIVPVDTLVWCLGVALVFHLFQFGWNFMHWIFALFRGHQH